MKKSKKEKNYKIYLFRHGRTGFNEKGIFTGWKNPSLTRRGIEETKRVAEKLKGKKIDIAFQTRLSRSKETLKIVLNYHPECKKIITDDRIIERSYGILEGASHEEFIKRVGKQTVDLMIEGDALENLEPRFRKKLERFLGEQEYNLIHRGYGVSVPKGESFRDVEKRVKSFMKDLKKLIKNRKVNVAISGHGNSIRVFRKIWEKASEEEAINWFIPYEKVYAYEIKA